MSVGLTVYDLGGVEFLDVCRAAEAAGIDRIWLGEHVVLPKSSGSTHPTTTGDLDSRAVLDDTTRLLDPFTALGAAAAATTTLGLATGIYLIGLRHPLSTARALATLHDLSGGRVVLGVGAGWQREEFGALGVDFGSRYRRLLECLQIQRLACRGGEFSFDGEFYSFDTVEISKVPLDVPIVLGGNADPALRRAVVHADGWISSGVPSIDEAVRLRHRLQEMCDREGRERPMRTWYRVPGSAPDLRDRYRAAGIDDIVLVTAEVRHVLGLDASEALRADAFQSALSAVVSS